jgi:type IV pilus assembly protein PilB
MEKFTRRIKEKAEEAFFEYAHREFRREWDEQLLDQYRHQGEGMTFLEFLGEKSGQDMKSLIEVAARETHRPIVETDTLPMCPTSFLEIEGFMFDLSLKTAFGSATLIHALPCAHIGLREQIEIDGELWSAEELLMRYLGVFKLHHLTGHPPDVERTLLKRRASGKLQHMTWVDIARHKPGDIGVAITALETMGLLKKKKIGNERATEWQRELCQSILEEIHGNKPKEGMGLTEWTAMTNSHPFLNLENTPIQERLVNIFPAQSQKRYECFPLHQEGRLMTLAVHTIPSVQTRTEMAQSISMRGRFQYVLAPKTQVMSLVNKALSTKVNLAHIAGEIEHEEQADAVGNELIDIEELLKAGKDDDTTVIQLLQALLVQAVQDKATDIHVASAPDQLAIRFRIDGILIPYPHQLPRGLDKPLITRIKIVSSINTQRTGLPEDGKFSTTISGLDYEIRVTTCPTIHGEKAVMRVQPKSSHIPTLESLGFQGIEKQVVLKSIETDHGLLVICGPTGSGKSTTLYAAIGLIDRNQWNVITGEQPVEIKIPGCEQTNITNNLTFGKFVTATLRQDPDYIMIGETRDKETTEELVRAAITGHVVLTTLHTNSAPSAPARLIDLGAKPYLLADALTGVCAQRLLRKLCNNCAQQVPLPSKKKLQELGIREDWMAEAEYICQPVGCKMCRNTGYAGRVAVIEGYICTKPIREIIESKHADPRAIQAIMEEQGSKSLFQHAVENVAKGLCSLQDAMTIQTLD